MVWCILLKEHRQGYHYQGDAYLLKARLHGAWNFVDAVRCAHQGWYSLAIILLKGRLERSLSTTRSKAGVRTPKDAETRKKN